MDIAIEARTSQLPRHFAIVVDKSALQSLTKDEAEWLFHHFRVNMPPVFFAEVIADIHKSEKTATTGSGVGDAKMLASKIVSAFVDLNDDAAALVAAEVQGATFPLDGRPIITSDYVPMPDGSFAAFIDQAPMQRVLDRWQEGNFEEMEKEFSRRWRETTSAIDLEQTFRDVKKLRIKTIDTPEKVIEYVDRHLLKEGQRYANLISVLKTLGVPVAVCKKAVNKWKSVGRPEIQEFLPYAWFITRLRMFFLVAVGHQVISTRKSNSIDFDYFQYLPFTRVFCSNDRIHSENFNCLSFPHNHFISGLNLKEALKEMSDYYQNLPDSIRDWGSFSYADFPPVHMDNAVTQAYDFVMPGWRDGANERPEPRDPARDARIMRELQPLMDAVDNFKRKGGRG